MSDALLEARAALCDLLMGRILRMRAEGQLRQGLALERRARFMHPAATAVMTQHAITCLENAAHYEWIACRAEQGAIRWGGRLNRCGYQPREE